MKTNRTEYHNPPFRWTLSLVCTALLLGFAAAPLQAAPDDQPTDSAINLAVDSWNEYSSAEENAWEGGARDVTNDLKVN
jgi:hypothetical protein